MNRRNQFALNSIFVIKYDKVKIYYIQDKLAVLSIKKSVTDTEQIVDKLILR